jgi:Na+-driven multidrug efflux pump
MDAFKEWGKFLQLAIPGLIMTCAEFWAFEIQTLFAGYFGTEYLSAQVRPRRSQTIASHSLLVHCTRLNPGGMFLALLRQ